MTENRIFTTGTAKAVPVNKMKSPKALGEKGKKDVCIRNYGIYYIQSVVQFVLKFLMIKRVSFARNVIKK